MKLLNYNLLFILLLALGCSKGEESIQNGYLKITNPTSETTTKAVSVSDFTVTVRRSNDERVHSAKMSEYPERFELAAGTYYLDVQFPNNDTYVKAAFDQPLYMGRSTEFMIIQGATTTAESVECKLSNMKVTLAFDNTVADKYSSYSATVSVSATDYLTYSSSESREGWFEVLPLKVKFTGTRIDDGSEESHEFSINDNIEKGYHHKINISIK